MLENLLCGAIALIIVFLIFKIISLPIRVIFKLLLNTLCGLALLFVVNLFNGLTGIWIEPTFFNSAIAGVLGLPGIGLLLVLQWLL